MEQNKYKRKYIIRQKKVWKPEPIDWESVKIGAFFYAIIMISMTIVVTVSELVILQIMK